MQTYFSYKSRFFCPKEELFKFHESPKGFETLVGLDPNVKVLKRPNSLLKGEEAILKVDIFPGISKNWISLHTDYKEKEYFEDTQMDGPFKKFIHKHIFSEDGDYSILEDRIEFDFFLLPISKYFIYLKLKPQFQKRHIVTAKTLGVKSENLFCGLYNK
ncbi:MAG: SRPBCC family protein [Leptospiraceae bacterium]|nr:SRPBCC family protein [Leptospiraceae bacterium]